MICGMLWSCLITGCATWHDAPTGDLPELALPKLAPDSVILETAFVRIPKEAEGFTDRFWCEVDEEALPNDIRRRLATNGFRVGLVGLTVPTELQELLDNEQLPQQPDGIAAVQVGSELSVRSHRMRSRAGHPGKLVVRHTPVERMAALTLNEDGKVVGQSLDQAQFHFVVKSYPQGNGQVLLQLTPVIEHGQPRSRYVGQQGVWALDNNSRPTKVLEDLVFQLTLSPGESIAIGRGADSKGLGGEFFAPRTDEEQAESLILIRLQQTQLDDRFHQDDLVEPIESIAN
jgi:hypothetical protein